jgi:hypothetical protein
LSVFQDQPGITPGDGVPPPFVVHLPDFQDLLDLPDPSLQVEKTGTASTSHPDPKRLRGIQRMESLGIELLHHDHGSKFRRAWRLSGIRDHGSTSTTR